jgi:serine/threonine protein phosphatase PrpC
MNITTDSCLRRNNNPKYDKPNEDYLIKDAENLIFIVADGVSRDPNNGVYPNPSPSAEAAKAFSDFCYEYILNQLRKENCSIDSIIRNAFEEGNKLLKVMNETYQGDFLPGTVAIIGVLRNGVLEYAFVGDCGLYLVRNNELRRLTFPQTHLISQHKSEFSATFIRNEISNNINHPYSYGVINGQNGVLDFVEKSNVDLFDDDLIIMASDGLEPIMENEQLEQLLKLSAEEIVNLVEKYELERNIRSDDKSIILLKVKSNQDGPT